VILRRGEGQLKTSRITPAYKNKLSKFVAKFVCEFYFCQENFKKDCFHQPKKLSKTRTNSKILPNLHGETGCAPKTALSPKKQQKKVSKKHLPPLVLPPGILFDFGFVYCS